MNGSRILVMIVLFMLIFSMSATADETYIFDSELKVNEGIKIEQSISIEIVDISRDAFNSAKFRISSYLKPVREITIFQGDTYLTEYKTYSGASIYIEVTGVYSDSVRFRVTGPGDWLVTDYYTVEAEPEESETVTVPKLDITRTFDVTGAAQGQTVKVTLKIKNTGNGAATNIVLDEPAIGGAYRDGCPSSIDDISAGETTRINYDLKIVDAEPGTYELDSAILNYMSESGISYSSESLTSVLEIIAEEILAPELVVSIDSVDDVIICGDEFPATIRIENVGNATTGRVNIKSRLPDDVRVVNGDPEPVYESIKPGDYEEYDLTLLAYAPGMHAIEMLAMWEDREAGASFEFRAEKSGLEKYYLYILIAIPIVLLLLWLIKRHREYSL